MENTIKHALPYIMAAQAQKHVTHNEALRTLDALIQLSVKAKDVSDPPSDPSEGDAYLIGVSPTAVWANYENQFTVFQDGAWAFHPPKVGWIVWVEADETLLIFDGTDFRALESFIPGGDGNLQNMNLLGIATQADANNRLSVQSPGSLYTHDGDDHRVTINKAGSTDTASIVFQNDWSGRAEFGLIGSDDFAMKVSDDGVDFVTAMTIDHQTGAVGFPKNNFSSGVAVNLLQDAGRLSSSSNEVTVGAFQFPDYFSLYNGTTVSGIGKFIHDNSDYGGTKGALHPSARLLVDKLKDPSARRYGLEYWICECVAGAGVVSPYNSGGITHYKSAFGKLGPSLSTMTFHIYLRAIDDQIVLRRRAPEMVFSKDGVVQASDVVILPTDDWVSVSLHWSINPRTHLGYSPTHFDLYCANAADKWQFACPSMIAGIVDVNPDQGILASYNMWPAS